MTTKLIACLAVFALLFGVVSTSMMHNVYADMASDKKMADAKKIADAKKMADAKKIADTKKIADAKKIADKKMVTTPAKVVTPASTKAAPTTGAITVEIAKGSGSDTKCGDKCYIPNTVQVKVGSTVTWKNVDAMPHSVSSGKDATHDGIFDSGMMMKDASFSYKFVKAGTIDYYCMVHPWMMGKVTAS
ncbi:MAG: plastocyanin/azurin family copper-binding protein [Nitrosarchaeum sp.]|nr:plastocyanin/azurin family copper-binding protein [Nitrosarchaeum sp.]